MASQSVTVAVDDDKTPDVPNEASIAVQPQTGKLLYLESLRGLAALIVAVHHFSQHFCTNAQLTWRNIYFPDAFIGHFQVTIFFLLSGRVLTVSILKKIRDPQAALNRLGSAVLRRPFRLGLPVMVMLVICYFLEPFIYDPSRKDIPAAILEAMSPKAPSAAPNPRKQPTMEMNNLFDLMTLAMSLFTGHLHIADRNDLNGVIWTIPVEYSCSNLIYLLTATTLVFKKGKYLFLTILAFFAWLNGEYSFVFIVGLMMAYFEQDHGFITTISKLSNLARCALLGLCAFLWLFIWFGWSLIIADTIPIDSWSFLFFEGNLGNPNEIMWYDPRTSISISSIFLLVLVESSAFLQSSLSIKPLVFLGRISFGVYLFHPICLYIFASRIWRWLYMSLGIQFEVSVLMTFFLGYIPMIILGGYLATKFIDEPSIALAKRLAALVL